MGYNIRLIDDVIDYFDQSQKEGLLFSADFQKAFDSLDWNFIFKTLDFFNFGPSFKQWIKTLYTLPVAKVKNNGHLSDEFSIQRGIRQGCPVSALLFILSIEIFGLRIRQELQLKGFNFGFPSKPIKIVQYADDCILLLNNRDELCTAISILDDFGIITGLKLNLSKCEGMWLGRNKCWQKNCKLFGIRWPNQLRCLGVYLGYSKEENIQMNWTSKIDKVQSILDSWSKRDLSLFGKIQVIKTFALSQFVLPATVLVVTPGIIKQIETMLYRFLWNGKPHKVKHLKVIRDVKHGGLNMVDVRSAFMSFKASWVQRFLRCEPSIHGWAQLAHSYLKPFLDCNAELIFNFDDTVYFPNIHYVSSFYKDVFSCYNKAFVKNRDDFISCITDEYLWGSKFFVKYEQGKNMVLFLRNWIRSGVNKVRDLCFVDEKSDVDRMHDKIVHKGNIYTEILTVRKALLPYQEYLKHGDRFAFVHESHDFNPKRSKDFYIQFRNMLTKDVPIASNYLCNYCTFDDLTFIFRTKVVEEKEMKLREFNFKLLHGILPCNTNLKRWKLRTTDNCDVCQESQSIEHLLWKCDYVKPLWSIVEKVCDLK